MALGSIQAARHQTIPVLFSTRQPENACVSAGVVRCRVFQDHPFARLGIRESRGVMVNQSRIQHGANESLVEAEVMFDLGEVSGASDARSGAAPASCRNY